MPLNVPLDSTFLFSGWAKGAADPDSVAAKTEESEPYFGLVLRFYYSDDTSGAGLSAFVAVYSLGMTAYQTYCSLNPTPSAPPAETASIQYPPNDGFSDDPYPMTLQPGTQLSRFGGEKGKFVTLPGTAAESLSLPPDKVGLQPVTYTVTAPIEVMAGTAQPWFGQPGGGIQYLLPQTIEQLISQGRMAKIK